MAAKLVTVLNTTLGAIGLNSLPAKDRDGKPILTSVQHFNVPAQSLDSAGKPVPGACEIPADLWKDLAANDDFTRGHIEARRLVVDESVQDSTDDQKSKDDANKGKPAK